MSNKNEKTGPKRSYQMKVRARRRDQVHQRITLAAVELHETVGPARTTMEAIARKAGVRRATVYNHFPTDLELADACSSHWFMEHPPPDLGVWREISDPEQRVITALTELYSWYSQGRDMLGKVLRDAPLVPSMNEILRRKWVPLLEQIVAVLTEGFGSEPPETERNRKASLAVAVDFFTWQSLADSGLSPREAARLAAGWVRAAGRARS